MTQTLTDLAQAYLTVADLHRQAAREAGEYSFNRAIHAQNAERAETSAMSWLRTSRTLGLDALREVSHG
jgi:hypothetical protein